MYVLKTLCGSSPIHSCRIVSRL